eukprot:15477948-Alexandrium_andersonii.AAC.1
MHRPRCFELSPSEACGAGHVPAELLDCVLAIWPVRAHVTEDADAPLVQASLLDADLQLVAVADSPTVQARGGHRPAVVELTELQHLRRVLRVRPAVDLVRHENLRLVEELVTVELAVRCEQVRQLQEE